MFFAQTLNFFRVGSINGGHFRPRHSPHGEGVRVRDVAASDQTDGNCHFVSIIAAEFPRRRLSMASRRQFLSGLGGTVLAKHFSGSPLMAATPSSLKLSVITDEISQDLDHALAVAHEFGLHYVELRAMWNKNLMDLKEDQVKEASRLLTKYGMK